MPLQASPQGWSAAKIDNSPLGLPRALVAHSVDRIAAVNGRQSALAAVDIVRRKLGRRDRGFDPFLSQ
jgi:hypothetical protein